MLATAPLIDPDELAFLQRVGFAKKLLDHMDQTTECISLSTAAFDDLPESARAHLKRSMELHLGHFGRIYLGAMLIAFGSSRTEDVCRAFGDAMAIFEGMVMEIAEDMEG